MSEKLTRITIPGDRSQYTGLMDWGEHTREEMVRQLRRQSQTYREAADAIDATADADFDVDIIRGPVAQKHVRKVP